MLFDGANNCKMVDWQFTAVGNVFLDFGVLAYLSMGAEETEANMDKLIDAFYNKCVFLLKNSQSKVLNCNVFSSPGSARCARP